MKDHVHMSYFKTIFPLNIDAYNIWSALFGSLIAFIWNVQPFITLLIILVFADLIVGLFAAKYRKEKITSRGIFRTVEKIVVELVAILACEVVRTTLFAWVDITYVVVFTIAMAELKSLLENVEVILQIKLWKEIKMTIKNKIKW